MPEKWIEIRAKGPGKKRDEAARIFIDAGSPGVLEVEDRPEAVGKLVSYSTWDDEQGFDGAFEAAETVEVKAYIEAAKPGSIGEIGKELKKIGWSIDGHSLFKDTDWSKAWMKGIKPVRVSFQGTSILVKPTWKDVKKRPGEIVIEIDPGMAFGTGSHHTTKMCLRAILGILKNEKRPGLSKAILDVGTGTGILAIAARKLKVRRAVGTEIDPVALKVARKNAKLNKAALELTGKPVDKVKGAFPIVVANILAGALISMAGGLSSKVERGGYLILSGILVHEVPSIIENFALTGVKPVRRFTSGEWAAITFKKI